MPKILITGSNGLLGQHIIKLFRDKSNWSILATARGENRLRDQTGYTYRTMDICDEDAVNRVFEEENPDFVIHGAAMTQVDRCESERETCWDVNVEATGHLIRAAGRAGAFFIFISTDFIFDGAAGPYREPALPHPVNYYGLSKLAAEMQLKGSDLDYSILRTILVYGKVEDPSRSNIVLWVKRSLEEGKEIHVVDDQWRTPTLVQDLAEGCRLVIDRKLHLESVSAVYHISGKELLTPYQMALQIADFFHLDAGLIKRADASTFSQTARRPAKTGFLLDRAEQDLSYRPHSFKAGLELMFND